MDLPDNWFWVLCWLIVLAAIAIFITTVRGCTETEDKLYVECVKAVTTQQHQSAMDAQQACRYTKVH